MGHAGTGPRRAVCGLQESWRRPKGIDSRVRRKFKGCGVIMPNIGYGTNKKTRHMLPNGVSAAGGSLDSRQLEPQQTGKQRSQRSTNSGPAPSTAAGQLCWTQQSRVLESWARQHKYSS